MRLKLALFVIFSVIFSSLALAVETAETSDRIICPDYEAQILKCSEDGRAYTPYTKDGCTYAECYDKCARDEDCPVINCITTPCPQHRCIEGRCKAYYDCPTAAELETQAIKCKNEGKTYSAYYEGECKRVKCDASACPGEDQLNRAIEECRVKGLEYTKKLIDNCRQIECIRKECPAETSMRDSIEKCKKEGLNYYEHVDGHGCKVISCKVTEPVQCRKQVSEECVKISCNDGYNFNSCEYKQECRTDCKRYTDEHGCLVKVCSDGYEEKHCETEEVKCEIEKLENGCEKKVCTDGRTATHCPNQKECKAYSDENGCTVKECSDGYKKRECPETKGEKEIECKVYVDENNCKIKKCSNGLTINYCEQPSCRAEKDKDGCEVKTCNDEYVSRICPEKEEVECITIKDTNSSCTVKICSDGFETKNCRELENAAVAAAAQQSADEGAGFFGFFRRLFG